MLPLPMRTEMTSIIIMIVYVVLIDFIFFHEFKRYLNSIIKLFMIEGVQNPMLFRTNRSS